MAPWSRVALEAPQLASAVRARFDAQTGYPPAPGPFHLFRADVSEVSMVQPAGDHLDIEFWREGSGATRIERR